MTIFEIVNETMRKLRQIHYGIHLTIGDFHDKTKWAITWPIGYQPSNADMVSVSRIIGEAPTLEKVDGPSQQN